MYKVEATFLEVVILYSTFFESNLTFNILFFQIAKKYRVVSLQGR